MHTRHTVALKTGHTEGNAWKEVIAYDDVGPGSYFIVAAVVTVHDLTTICGREYHCGCSPANMWIQAGVQSLPPVQFLTGCCCTLLQLSIVAAATAVAHLLLVLVLPL